MLASHSQPRVFPRVLSEALLLTAALSLASGCSGAIDDTGFREGFRPGQTPGPNVGAGGSAAAPGGPKATGPNAADQQMQTANPTLFETARNYFPSDSGAAPPERLSRLTRTQLD